MDKWNLYLGVALSLVCLAVQSGYAQTKLEAAADTSPAIVGYFGNPALGLPGPIRSDKVLWHANGKILALMTSPHAAPASARLGMWEVDAPSQQVLFQAAFDTRGAWCLSTNGNVLCTQVQRGQTGSLSGEAGNLGCFKLADRTCLWELPVAKNESIVGLTFTKDDSRLVILSIRNRQMSLRLFESRTGTEVKRHDFEFPEERTFSEEALEIHGNDIWMERNVNGEHQFLTVPLTTLQPQINREYEKDGVREISADGRWMTVITGTRLTLFERRQGKWLQVQQEAAKMVMREGYVVDAFFSAQFTADSKKLIIVQRNQISVKELPSFRQTATASRWSTAAGVLSAEGRRLLVKGHGGFEILLLDSLKPAGLAQRLQHAKVPGVLRFLDGGKTLASADPSAIWLWDVASRKPKAVLNAWADYAPYEAHITLAVADGGRALVSDEGAGFATWELPKQEAAPSQPTAVMPKPAFGPRKDDAEQTVPTSVFADVPGKNLVAFDASGIVLHEGVGAAASKTLKKGALGMLADVGFFDRESQNFYYLNGISDGWMQINLQTAAVTEVTRNGMRNLPPPPGLARRGWVRPIMALPLGMSSLGYSDDCGFGITSLDGSTLKLWLESLPKDLVHGNGEAAISADEKWLVAQLSSKKPTFDSQHLAVWNLESGKLEAVWKLPANSCMGLAFSPDSSLLACSHHNLSISLWDMKKVLAEHPLVREQDSAPAAQPKPAVDSSAPAQPKGTSSTRVPSQTPAAFPASSEPSRERRVLSLARTSWNFNKNGQVTKADYPETGRLKINGTSFESAGDYLTSSYLLKRHLDAQNELEGAIRSRTPVNPGQLLRADSYAMIAGGTISQSEGRVGDLWIARQTGAPTGNSARGCLTFTDAFTNMAAQPLHTRIEFEAIFPEGTSLLMDSSYRKVAVGKDGRVALTDDAWWVAPVMSAQSGQPVPVLIFRSRSSTLKPEIFWVAAENRLIARYELSLEPFQVRYLAHGACLIPREAGSSPEIFDEPPWRDFSRLVPLDVRELGINFGTSFEPDAVSNHAARNNPGRDRLGFQWREKRDGSLAGELGAVSVLQLGMDDSPLAYASNSIFDCLSTAQLMGHEPPTVFTERHGYDVKRKVKVVRSFMSHQQPLHMVKDTFTNMTSEPVTTKVCYTNVLAGPIKSMRGATGNTLNSGKDLSLADTGGAVILELAGEMKPATLIGFYEEGAELTPKLQMLNEQILKIEYELPLAPGQRISLWHGAVQRPLAGFADVGLAFTGCLPFRKNSPSGTSGKSNVN